MNLKLKTAPATEPVTVTEAKEYLRVDGNIEDGRILTMIKAATSRLEQYCDQKFISQVWYQYMDRFPFETSSDWWDGTREGAISELYGCKRTIDLLIGPLRSVVAFNTYADDGVAVPFSGTNFVTDTSGPYGRIALKMGETWPTTVLRGVNGIEIEMEVGMVSTGSSLHADIKQAVLEYVATLYENRGDEKPAIPLTAMALLTPYRRFKGGSPGGR